MAKDSIWGESGLSIILLPTYWADSHHRTVHGLSAGIDNISQQRITATLRPRQHDRQALQFFHLTVNSTQNTIRPLRQKVLGHRNA